MGFLACLLQCACYQDNYDLDVSYLEQELARDSEYVYTSHAYFHNHPLPIGKKSLRVLAIGNSYTQDAVWYARDILAAAGVDSESYSIYMVIHEAASLQYWWEQAEQNSEVNPIYLGGAHMLVENGTLAELLAQEWDVVTLQQSSELSINHLTFNPYLHNLIDFVQSHCPNPDVTLAWQMAWSYNDVVVPGLSNYERWLLIANTTLEMETEDGIDVLIPVGTAIQNARNTELDSESQLTRDGWHLDYGIGRYIAACTWVQSLYGPVYDLTVMGNTALPVIDSNRPKRYVSQPVTEENRGTAQHCAVEAVQNPYQLMGIPIGIHFPSVD